MSTREQAVTALVVLIAGAYAWKTPPSRRLKMWSDVAPVQRPVCFVFEGGTETYEPGAAAHPKRSLDLKLFVYIDSHDPNTIGAALLNTIMDAIDNALLPTEADDPLGRVTLGGTAYRCAIAGKPMKDPGDLDGDGLLIVPIQIILP